jgi:hypothetical protein
VLWEVRARDSSENSGDSRDSGDSGDSEISKESESSKDGRDIGHSRGSESRGGSSKDSGRWRSRN